MRARARITSNQYSFLAKVRVGCCGIRPSVDAGRAKKSEEGSYARRWLILLLLKADTVEMNVSLPESERKF